MKWNLSKEQEHSTNDLNTVTLASRKPADTVKLKHIIYQQAGLHGSWAQPLKLSRFHSMYYLFRDRSKNIVAYVKVSPKLFGLRGYVATFAKGVPKP